MRRWIVIVSLLLVGILLAGLVLSILQRVRLDAAVAASRNNLREIALFAHMYVNPQARRDNASFPREIPAGTIVLPDVSPQDRLAWTVSVLPVLNQKRQDVSGLLSQIDPVQPWTAEANQVAGRTSVAAFLCPGVSPQTDPNSPAITCYVGISGLAPPDPATIELQKDKPPSPVAGAFRYDAPTPFNRIVDGLSQTLLMGETANEPGPWLRGGFSTLRGLNDARDAKPVIGFDGQFGGYFAAGGHFAMCDGSVRLFTPQTSRYVLYRHATIADGQDAIPVD